MSNKNARALSVLDRIAKETGIIDTAKYALIQAINPFMDFEQPKAGWFDTNESQSVIQCVKFSTTISSAGLAAGNYDAHVFTTPIINPVGFVNSASLANGILACKSATAILSSVGGVTAIAGTAGQPLNLAAMSTALPGVISNFTGTLNPVVDQTAAAVSYLSGACRVIGMGFEVHNTTAEINLQGSVAVYKQPQPVFNDRDDVLILNTNIGGTITAPSATAANQGDATAFLLNDVPGTLAGAMLLQGTRQWEAKDGAMVIPTINDTNIPVQQLRNSIPFFRDTTGNQVINYTALAAGTFTGYTGSMISTLASPVTGTLPGAWSKAQSPLVHAANFNSSGAFFTGLSNATTLVVNVIYYIERFPTVSDADLIVLAQPSPPFSSAAFNLYPLLMQSMPPGVKVKDNADGDWFFEAVQSVSDFIMPAVKMLPGPLGSVAAPFVSAVNTWAGNKLKDRNPGSSITPSPALPPRQQQQAKQPAQPKRQAAKLRKVNQELAQARAAFPPAAAWGASIQYPPNVITKAQKKAFRRKHGW